MDKQVIIGVNDIQVENGKQRVALEDIALWNEYGTSNAPPRPAFREGSELAIRTNEKLIEGYLSNVFMNSMRDDINVKSDAEKQLRNLLTQLGRSAVKEVKNIIKSGSTAPNAPATVKKKGFNHPLFHKGKLLENVNYQIEDITE